MKTIIQFKKLLLLFLLLFVSSFSWGQTLSQTYNPGQNYYTNNFQKNLDFVNTVFIKNYTTYVGQNPGNLNAEFMTGPWPPGSSVSGSSHKGVDFRAQQSYDLFSPLNGVVTEFGGDTGKICIYNATYNLTFVFIHCSVYNVSIGQNITKGQYIGKTGAVGADAPHLHVELRSGEQKFAATSASLPTNSYDPRIIMDFFPICSTLPPLTTTPTNTQTNVGIPVNLDWSDVSGSNPQYRIQVSTTSSGWTATNGFTTATTPSATIRVNENTLSTSSYSWDTTALTLYPPQPFTTYYYTVKAYVCGQSTNYSAVKSFTTGCVATIPNIISPSNGITNTTIPVNFDWSDSSGTNPEYRIHISTNPNSWTAYDGFTTATSPNPVIRVNENTNDVSAYSWASTSSYPPQNGITYYWTVKTFACGNNSQWSAVRSITIANSVTNYTITTSSNPSVGGGTSGGGTYANGTSRTVTAIANSGYTFSNWTENGNQVSTNASYAFTLSANRNLVANFTQNIVNYTITTSSNPSVGGGTSGGGTYANSSSRTVLATANSGYTFSNWTENGNQVSTNASYVFTLSANRNLVANFTQNQVVTCLTCPNYDFLTVINSSWGNHSSSIQSNGCKIYKFLAVPGYTYTFKTGCEDGASSSFDSVLDLFDTNCSLISTNDDYCPPTSRIVWNCNYSATNWVYLKVKGYLNYYGNYTLAYTSTPDLSVIDNPFLKDIVVYPNPTKDIINIDAGNIMIDTISLFDNLGKVLKNVKINNSEYKLNIQNLPQAVYILEIKTEKGSQRVKVVKK